MSEVVLHAEGLGKMYRIGGEREQYRTLRDSLVHAAMRPIERIRRPGAATHHSEVLWALKNIDLDVRRGETVGIIGRNGAGKSTLLKVLSHITEPTEGRVGIKGRVSSLLEIGTGFHSELTGRENIRLNGAILGMKRAEMKRRFDEIVEFSEIGRFLDTPVKRYSSGMYVRLAFAVAAHLDPEILIIDEVLAVGDAEFQKKCLGRMGDMATSGRTVLFVSHNMGAISQLCSTAVLIEGGKVKQQGSTQDIVSAYLSAGYEESNGVVEFDTGGGDAELTKAWFQLEDGTTTNTIPVTSTFDLYIEYIVRRPAKSLTVGFNVADRHGSKVFYSEVESQSVSGGSGTYIGSARLPGNFLAPGPYSVSISLHVPNIVILDRRMHALSFEIVETGSAATTYAGADVGSILVELEWEQRREEHLPRVGSLDEQTPERPGA